MAKLTLEQEFKNLKIEIVLELNRLELKTAELRALHHSVAANSKCPNEVTLNQLKDILDDIK